MRDGWCPVAEGACFAELQPMRPVIEDENSAVGQAGTEITETVQSRLINIAIDACIRDLADGQRIGRSQAVGENPRNELDPIPFGQFHVG